MIYRQHDFTLKFYSIILQNLMKKLFIFSFVFLVHIKINAQLSNKQGISTFGIRPSVSVLTFGLPQNSTAGQQSILSYFPYPFTSLPLNLSTNKSGKTDLSWLYGSFDLGLNITKLLPNDHIIRDRKSTRLNSSHRNTSRMPSSA